MRHYALAFLIFLIGCSSYPELNVQSTSCVPTPDGTLYAVSRTLPLETCDGADVVAFNQTLGSVPGCQGYWLPSDDRCTYDVYASCPFEQFEWHASVQVITTLSWNADWSHGTATQAFWVVNVVHYKVCEGNQNIVLDRE